MAKPRKGFKTIQPRLQKWVSLGGTRKFGSHFKNDPCMNVKKNGSFEINSRRFCREVTLAAVAAQAAAASAGAAAASKQAADQEADRTSS